MVKWNSVRIISGMGWRVELERKVRWMQVCTLRNRWWITYGEMESGINLR